MSRGPWTAREFARAWDRQALRVARALQACAAWLALAEHQHARDRKVPREVVQRLAEARRDLRVTLNEVGLGLGRLGLEGRIWDLQEPEAWHLGHLVEQEWVRWQRGRASRAKAS